MVPEGPPAVLTLHRLNMENAMKKQKSDRTRQPALLSLRPDAGPTDGAICFTPAGRFAARYASGGWRPLCLLGGAGDSRPGGQILLSSGPRIAVDTLSAAPGSRPEVLEVQLPSEPSAAFAAPGSPGAVLMLDGGACLLDASGSMLDSDACADFPQLRLVSVGRGRISTGVGPRALHGDYATPQDLSAADMRDVSADIAGAYRRLRALAAEADVMIQPALVAYRLLDSRGNVLHSSAPTLLMAPSGPQCAEAVAVTSSDRVRLDPYTLWADTWSAAVDIPADAAGHARWADVATVEIVASAQFHPDTDSAAGASVAVGRTASEPFLRVALPGRGSALGSAWRSRSQSNVIAAAGRFEAECRRIALLPRPDAGMSVAAGATPLAPAGGRGASGVTDGDMAELLPPHTFTAKHVGADDAVVLWADITRRRFRGYPMEAFATQRAGADAPAGAWHAAVAVDFDDGEKVVCTSEGIGDAPLNVGPLLSYPSPHARRMTLALSVGGQSYRRVVDLQPDASGLRAVYVDASLRPFTPALTAEPFAPGASRSFPRRFADVLLTSSPAAPLSPYGVLRSGRGSAVCALLPAPGANQAWEFGSRRFYVGGDGGIASLTLRSDGRAAFKMLDPRPLRRPDAIVAADDAVYALLGSGTPDLVRIESGRVSTLMSSPAPAAAALGWSAPKRELTLFSDGSDEALSVATDHSLMCFRRPLPGAFSRVYAVGDAHFALCGDVLCRLAAEATDRVTEVAFDATFTLCGGLRAAPSLLRADFCGDSCQGYLSATVAGGAEMLRVRFNGTIPRGLSLPWPPSRRTARVAVGLHASVSPDFCLHGIIFQVNNVKRHALC